MPHIFLKGLGITVACGLASEFLYQLYKYFKSKECHNATNKIEDNKTEVSEVLFFPDKEIACKDYFTEENGCTNVQCRFTHQENSLSTLYRYLSSAQSSLDVCVFVICCADLGDLLIGAHQRGVRLRVICDNEQIDISGSQIWKLRKHGVNVRTDKSSYLMHHKFVVIDRQTLINGSFNWTRQAISGNQENLMILKNTDIVQQYMGEFEKLWNDFDPKIL